MAEIDKGDAKHAAENFSTLPALPKTPTAAQAVAWLEDILMRRTVMPEPGVPYRIPNDKLLTDDDGEFATGPSIIEGDAPVRFRVVEEKQGKPVVVFGPEGSKYGRDMPLASDRLKPLVTKALRYLPGYTEFCEVTGNRLNQPLTPITYKLLRGEIRRWQDIHFITKSKEGIEEEKKQRLEEAAALLEEQKERKSKQLKKMLVRLSSDSKMRKSATQLHNLVRDLFRASPEPASQPWNFSIPAQAIMDQAAALREGQDLGPEPLTSLLSAYLPPK